MHFQNFQEFVASINVDRNLSSTLFIYLRKIITSLRTSERCTIPRIPHASLRPFWNDECDDLKDKSIFWHNLWKSAGSPAAGTLHQIKASCTLICKLAIKQAFLEFENQHNDQLFDHLLNKRVPEFWKCWASKFRCNLTKDIYGSNKPSNVYHAFADHFLVGVY